MLEEMKMEHCETYLVLQEVSSHLRLYLYSREKKREAIHLFISKTSLVKIIESFCPDLLN